MLTPPDGDMERDLLMPKPRRPSSRLHQCCPSCSLRRQLPTRLCLDPSCHPQDCPYPSHLHPRCRRPSCYLCWCPRCPHPSCQHSWIHSLLWKERGRGSSSSPLHQRCPSCPLCCRNPRCCRIPT